jgi:hypothetical protein
MYSTYSRLVLGAGLIFLCLPNARAIRYYDQFSSWYPEYGFIFQNLLEQNCSQEYHTYLYGTEDDTPVPWNDGGGEYTMYIEPVVQCLLENSSPYLMSSLIMSQLLLALTPTVLASVGVSSTETSLIAVVGKRPLLAAMLALASPATYISRAFKHKEILKLLLEKDSKYHRKMMDIPRLRHLFVPFQYVLAAAALANVIIVDWNLGIRAICMISPSFIYFPTIWTIFSIVLHGLMAISYHFRIKTNFEVDKPSTPGGFSSQIRQFLVHEFSLLGTYNVSSFSIPRETLMVIILDWSHSVLTIVQLLCGTLMFAGMLFIGPQDAIVIFLRYFASSLICRTILMFELSGLKGATRDFLSHSSTRIS